MAEEIIIYYRLVGEEYANNFKKPEKLVEALPIQYNTMYLYGVNSSQLGKISNELKNGKCQGYDFLTTETL